MISNPLLKLLAFFIILFSILSTPPGVLCEEGMSAAALPLRVEIEGNRKTRRSVIIRAAKLAEGQTVNIADLDANRIRTLILNTHLFSSAEVSVESTGTESVVHIKVKERFTPVPVPIFFTQREETGGGGFLFEPNLLGRQKILVLGVVATNRGERYQAIYVDNNVLGSRFVVMSRAFYGEVVQKRFSGDDQIFAYFQAFTNVFATVGYKITDEFIPSIGASYRSQLTRRVDDYPDPPDDLYSNSFILNLRYTKTNYRDYYDEGLAAMFLLDQATPMLGSDRTFTHMALSCDYTKALLRPLLLRLSGEWGGGAGEQDVLTYYREGGSVGSRGLPNRGIWVPDYSSLSVALEQPLYRHKWGTLTATQFGDVLITGEDEPVRSYPGVGLGLRIYLKQIALPAVGVDGAFSTWTQKFRFSAYIGKSF